MNAAKYKNGVWRIRLDCNYSGYNYGGILERSGSQPYEKGFVNYADIEYPFDENLIESEFSGGKTILRIPFGAGESLYGLGLGYKEISQTMKVKHIRCDHYGGSDNGRTHVPVPFYVSDAGYGIFVDTAAVTSFYMGGSVRLDAVNPPREMNRGRDNDWECDQRSEFVEVSFDGGKADIYVIAGANMTEVTAKFNLLCGGGCLPPKWGLGMWHRVHLHYSADNVGDEVARFAEHNMPLDVIGLEPGWQTNAYPCTHEWDRERFPDPAAFIADMTAKGVRINLWENMYLSKQAKIFDEIKLYCGSHTVWGGAVPDLCTDEARELMSAQHKRDHVDIGVSGYKIDECDGYDNWLWPDHAVFPSGVNGVEMRQIFAVMFARMMGDAYRDKNQRTYGLIRAANAGMSSMPFCIYNDCYDFKQYMTGLASAGFTGALWCPEIRDAKSSEEWVRRFQMGALSPMLMLNGWANGAKPWMYEDVEDIIRDTINLRYELLPYIYTAFADYRFCGIPPFRALCMDYSGVGVTKSGGELDHTDNPYQLKQIADVVDQYMMGESLMVAPVFTGNTTRNVILPDGEWYDYHTGEHYSGGVTITIDCPLERIPMFVKGGHAIPTMVDGGYVIRCYGDSGVGKIYDDDGLTFNYESGEYRLLHIKFTKSGGKITGNIPDMKYI